MGLYITGMNMPENGSCIQIVIDDDGKVYPSVENCIFKMGSIAKAVPVQEPHGRLGDLDELHKEAVRRSVKAGTHDIWYNCADRVICALDIKNAPAIIPASEEDE